MVQLGSMKASRRKFRCAAIQIHGLELLCAVVLGEIAQSLADQQLVPMNYREEAGMRMLGYAWYVFPIPAPC